MKRSKKFSPEYKQKLLSHIDSLTMYLERKTSYHIEMNVKYDKRHGYLYTVKVSTNFDFSHYREWTLSSTEKDCIKNELLEKILHSVIQNGGNNDMIQTFSQATCYSCKKIINLSYSSKQRQGYSPLCMDCANTYAVEIMEKSNFNAAILYLCSLFDKTYLESLSDEIAIMGLSPLKAFGLYFSRLNLHPIVKNKGNTFSNSDIFDFDKWRG